MPLQYRDLEVASSNLTSNRQHAGTLSADEERKLIGSVQRPAVFDEPQMPGGNLIVDAVVDHQNAVGNVFLQPMAGECFPPALGGDDGGHPLVLEPAKEPAASSSARRIASLGRLPIR